MKTESLVIILLCMIEVLIFAWVIYRFVKMCFFYRHKENQVKIRRDKGNKEVLEKYRKISPLSDVIMFVPNQMLQVIMTITSVFIYIYVDNDAGIMLFVLMTTFYIVMDFYCVMRVIKYNRFISKSILLQGKIVEQVSMHIEQKNVWVVDVWYQYTDPAGKEYKKKQTAQMFGNFYFEQQLKQWSFLYHKDTKVSVLVNPDDYGNSYLPMREDFCKFFNKYYSVDLRNFEEW